MAISADGARLAFATRNSNVRLTIISTDDFSTILTHVVEEVTNCKHLLFTKDPNIVVCSEVGLTVVIDLRDGTKRQIQDVKVAACHPNRMEGFGTNLTRIYSVDLEDGKMSRTYKGHIEFHGTVCLNRDGTLMASTGHEGTLIIHRVDAINPVRVINAFKLRTANLQFSRDSDLLMSYGIDLRKGILRMWDPLSSRPDPLREFLPIGSSIGNTFALNFSNIHDFTKVRDYLPSGAVIRSRERGSMITGDLEILYRPNRRYTFLMEHGKLVHDNAETPSIQCGSINDAAAVSDDGRYVAFAGFGRVEVLKLDLQKPKAVWRRVLLQSDKELAYPIPHKSSHLFFPNTPKPTLVFAVLTGTENADRLICRSYDLTTGKQTGGRQHFIERTVMKIEPLGNRILCGCTDGTIRGYDPVTLEETFVERTRFPETIQSVDDDLTPSLSSDGSTLIFGSRRANDTNKLRLYVTHLERIND